MKKATIKPKSLLQLKWKLPKKLKISKGRITDLRGNPATFKYPDGTIVNVITNKVAQHLVDDSKSLEALYSGKDVVIFKYKFNPKKNRVKSTKTK